MCARAATVWPPTAEDAPNSEEVLETLSELLAHGTHAYRDARESEDLLERLQRRLEGLDLELLMAYEEQTNRDCAMWAEDRFRIGYALGASTAHVLGP